MRTTDRTNAVGYRISTIVISKVLPVDKVEGLARRSIAIAEHLINLDSGALTPRLGYLDGPPSRRTGCRSCDRVRDAAGSIAFSGAAPALINERIETQRGLEVSAHAGARVLAAISDNTHSARLTPIYSHLTNMGAPVTRRAFLEFVYVWNTAKS